MPFDKSASITIEQSARRIVELEETVLTLTEQVKLLCERFADYYPTDNRKSRLAFIRSRSVKADTRMQQHTLVADLLTVSDETAGVVETVTGATEFQKDTTKPDDEQQKTGKWNYCTDIYLLDEIIKRFTPDNVR